MSFDEKNTKLEVVEVKKMKVGIIGLGNIAKRVANGVRHASHASLYAVASREIEKAEKFKEEQGAMIAYGSYEELLKDPEVELVYICTPNNLHRQHILLCLQYHKHVLCEKPLVTTSAQLKECFAYAKKQGCFLMEAEKTLFTPLNQVIKKMVEQGAIGELKYIEAGYCSYLDKRKYSKDSWLFTKEDGGSLRDVGVYPICYANYFADASLSEIQMMKRCAPEGYDLTTQGMLRYENGIMAYIRSSFEGGMENHAVLYGTTGNIKYENFWKTTSARWCHEGVEELVHVEMESDFTGEIEHAISCIEQGLLESPVLGQKQSEEIMKVLEK